MQRMKREHMNRFVDRTRDVLWETDRTELGRRSDPNHHPSGHPRSSAALPRRSGEVGEPRVWTGHTDNYLRVVARADRGVDLRNTITPTRLIAVGDSFLEGVL
jgi:hypothetical protein